MLTLHYAPDNASLIVRLALLEAGLPFRTALVDRRTGAQDSPAFRALNPAGLIPVLETPDGPVAETGAILLWLADRHPGTRLMPAPDHPDRGVALQWLFFLSNALHADLRQVFYADRYADAAGRAGHRALAVGRIQGHFALANAAAVARPAIWAPPSALAFYTAALMRWSVLYPAGQDRWFDPAAFPALTALAAAVEARPACTVAARAEGLGPRPFTAPIPPCPPEGSAT
ncbi:MAG TPA: glutathione S-transferase family protein [Paracoccaceae bacterium]|nr:glutathione S-transferase family protein [Paracoccaceae bacterium]HMO73256.1 glutathione S-transferase family protein [Paracoccaceae bacterium]